MDHSLPYATSCLLTSEEQAMLLRVGTIADEESFSEGYVVGRQDSMSVALADLRSNTTALLALLEQNRVSSCLPVASRKTYAKLLDRIDRAASQVTLMVDNAIYIEEPLDGAYFK